MRFWCAQVFCADVVVVEPRPLRLNRCCPDRLSLANYGGGGEWSWGSGFGGDCFIIFCVLEEGSLPGKVAFEDFNGNGLSKLVVSLFLLTVFALRVILAGAKKDIHPDFGTPVFSTIWTGRALPNMIDRGAGQWK